MEDTDVVATTTATATTTAAAATSSTEAAKVAVADAADVASSNGLAASSSSEPIVIVTSLGATVRPEDIINNIRRCPIEADTEQLGDGSLRGHRFTIRTKYYTSAIQFVHHDGSLDALPEGIRQRVEGVLVYFDAENRNILKQIDDHLRFAKTEGLQLLMLMCDKLYEDARLGMTYREVKHCTQMFIDIIELGRQREEEEDDNEEQAVENGFGGAAHHDPVGYDELLQVLQNNIWSNVNVAAVDLGAGLGGGGGLLADVGGDGGEGGDGGGLGFGDAIAHDDLAVGEFRAELADFMSHPAMPLAADGPDGAASAADRQYMKDVAELMAGARVASEQKQQQQEQQQLADQLGALSVSGEGGGVGGGSADGVDGLEQRVDAELLNYERLLSNLMAFRDTSASLSRSERFAYTQNFVDVFEELIGADEDGPAADSSPDEKSGAADAPSLK